MICEALAQQRSNVHVSPISRCINIICGNVFRDVYVCKGVLNKPTAKIDSRSCLLGWPFALRPFALMQFLWHPHCPRRPQAQQADGHRPSTPGPVSVFLDHLVPCKRFLRGLRAIFISKPTATDPALQVQLQSSWTILCGANASSAVCGPSSSASRRP